MPMRLKEDPKEWRKFALAAVSSQALLLFLLQRRTRLPVEAFWLGLFVLAILGVLACLFPHRCRGVYRIGMTVGRAISSVVTAIMLTVMFWLAVAPLGLLMRLLGKDPLKLKPTVAKESYWEKAAPFDDFERLF